MVLLMIALASLLGMSAQQREALPLHVEMEMDALALTGSSRAETYNARLLAQYNFSEASIVASGHFLEAKNSGEQGLCRLRSEGLR